MPSDAPFSFLAAEQPKPVKDKKPHWRGKLFSKDKKDRSTPDQQIEDFLASNRPVADNFVSTKPDHRDAPPTISTRQIPSSNDFAQLPAASIPSPLNENYTGFNLNNHSPPKTEEVPQLRELPQLQGLPQPPTNPHKPRKGKGLRVRFSDQGAEVIGEGGDETDAPTIEISFSRKRSRDRQAAQDQLQRSPSRSPNPSRSHLPALTVNTSLGDGDARSYRAGTPQEQRGGTSPNSTSKPPLMHTQLDADFLSTLHIEKPGSRLSFRGSPHSHSVAERVRDQMQAEEARALQQHRFDDDIASPADDDTDLSSPEVPSSHSPRSPNGSGYESLYEAPPYSATAPSVKSIVQSIRNPHNPAVQRAQSNLSPIDPRIPPNLTPGSPARASSGAPKLSTHEPQPVPPKSQVASPSTRELPRSPQPPSIKQLASPSTGPSREPSRSPQPPKYSLKSLANQVGDQAFSEFKEHVRRYDNLLHSAAENVKPLVETSLAEWIRAAAWWFLRGKTRLESYARSRNMAPVAHAKQAVLDLGKAFWINEKIVPGHYELSRYGSMGIDAVLAVASTTGDKEMVDLLSIHQTTLNHIRSLSMSIKRNNILTAILADDENSPSQLDTSVWLRYPFFAPDVSAVLSGSASRSMLADAPGKTPSMVNMMPLGDTTRFFSYGSMFVQACVSSRDDDGQQYAMPCALSIIRERSDWYVIAAITSQSQLVNVMIQCDRKQGPTWDDVDWQVRSNSMRVKLPRGFELDVMFKEDDFKMLWNIVRYTQKSEASLSPEAGETVVFENTLKVFQYMDPATPKAFPPEPMERCRIRLFERQVTVTEGTGTRNAHRGFRLTVLTSPKVKTLSNVKHILGHGSPVVFGLLRGEDGSPALLLKVTEDGRTRSMLMTFHEVEERTKIHSVLLSMMPRDGETKTREFQLRSYAIEEPGDPASGRPLTTHLTFPPGNAAVIDQEHDFVEHGYGPTILSEHLRAFIATEWGSVTDRINLGKLVNLLDYISGRPLLTSSYTGPGELKLGLDVNRLTGMSLYRPAQQDLTVSLADNLIRPEMPDQVMGFMQKATAKPMVRRFDFASMQGMLSCLRLYNPML